MEGGWKDGLPRNDLRLRASPKNRRTGGLAAIGDISEARVAKGTKGRKAKHVVSGREVYMIE